MTHAQLRPRASRTASRAPEVAWLAGVVGAGGSALVGIGEVGVAAGTPALAFVPGLAQAASTIGQPAGHVLVTLGVGVLAMAWWWCRPAALGEAREASSQRFADGAAQRPFRRGRPWLLLLVAWCAPLLLAPPVLSRDAWLYADLGWMVTRGIDPYVVGLAKGGGPFAASIDAFWAGHTVAYPPLSLQTAGLVVGLTGAHPYWSVVAMRLPALVAVAALLWCVPRLATRLGGDPDLATWLGVASPLVVLHFVGGAHNDAPMAALAVVAALLATRALPGGKESLTVSLGLAPAIVGVAMCFKQPAGLAVLAAAGIPIAARLAEAPLGRRLWLLGWRAGVAAIVALATFALVSAATGLGFGWTRAVDVMGLAGTLAPAYLLFELASHLAAALGTNAEPLRPVVALASNVAVVAGLAWAVIAGSRRPVRATGWAAAALVVLGQVLYPWYLVWSVIFVVVDRPGRKTRRLLIAGLAWLLLAHTVQTATLWPMYACAFGAAAVVWLVIRRGRTDSLGASDDSMAGSGNAGSGRG